MQICFAAWCQQALVLLAAGCWLQIRLARGDGQHAGDSGAAAGAALYDCSRDNTTGLALLFPHRGSSIRKGMIQLHYKAGPGASHHARFFIFTDEDALSRDVLEPDGAVREDFIYGAEESIKIAFWDVGYHTITVVQTCSPDGSGLRMEDMVYVGEVSTTMTVVNETKTGMEMDGVIDTEPRRYMLSAVTLFRDESRYLAEWIEFHLCAGVDHFYLFNHHSATREHETVLMPYIVAGLVELADAFDSLLDENGTVVQQAQLRTFTHAVQTHGADSEWMAFIDVDEFLYATGPVTIVDPFHGAFEVNEPSLPEVLLGYREFGGVVVHWMLYGSSGYRDTPVGQVVDRYVWRAQAPARMFKVVAQPSKIRRLNNHNHDYLPGFFAVDENNEMVAHNTSHKRTQTATVLRINHYRHKSEQHTRARLQRALLQDSFHRHDDSPDITQHSPDASKLAEVWEEEEGLSNAVWDSSAQRFRQCVRDGFLARSVPPLNAWITLLVDDVHAPERVNGTDVILVRLIPREETGQGGSTPGEDVHRRLRVRVQLWGAVGVKEYGAVLRRGDGSIIGRVRLNAVREGEKHAETLFHVELAEQEDESKTCEKEPQDFDIAAQLTFGQQLEEPRTDNVNPPGVVKLSVRVDHGRCQRQPCVQEFCNPLPVMTGVRSREGTDPGKEEVQACTEGGIGRLERLLGLDAEMVDAIVSDLTHLRASLISNPDRVGDEAQDGGVLGPMVWRGNTRSWLQELHGGLQRSLYREGLLPVGVRPGPRWAKAADREAHSDRTLTPHDGISDVWGIERGGAIVRGLIEQFLERVSPMLPRGGHCLEWGRHYSQTTLVEECHCGDSSRPCRGSWSLIYGGCTEGLDASRSQVCADVARLSLVVPASLRFDVVVCTQVFEHLPDPWAAARQLFAVMESGGKIVFTVPFIEPHHEAASQFKDYWRFSMEGARELLQGAGFHIDVLETAGNGMLAHSALMGHGVSDLLESDMHEATRCDYSAPGREAGDVQEAQYMGVHVLATKPTKPQL